MALGLDGTVLAKGTFNSLGQLESVLATAERSKIAIHVVGFGMNEAESRSAAAETRDAFHRSRSLTPAETRRAAL